MNKGTVKFFNETKGFGFIKSENGEEIFVHVTGLNEDIR
jgi:CspA family cold shock protein